ncbi:dolichyl-phosphate-mannose protein mannosyltransferase, putative [Hepatocystis sp. ex Piliocolobus tephrosceles]|nr:dolichyl-phosphate-mannose protein mannosyltransferase, putative [Hepatocystis sp. ex Piliocolobus tephrosceles]
MNYYNCIIKLFVFYFAFCNLYHCLYVTDGSSIILENIGTKYKLYSTDMKWGTGSENQLVTAVTTNKNNDELLWTVRVYDESKSLTGDKISCDEIVVLKHVKSNAYLTGSEHLSILSNNYELNINEDIEQAKFQIICEKKKKAKNYWKLGENVFLKNINKNGLLSTNKKYEFNDFNCHNCPILNHLETCILKSNNQNDNQKWKAKSGVILSHFHDDSNNTYSYDEF